MSKSAQTPRKIACYAFEDVMSLDVIGPLQVFGSANDELAALGRPQGYEGIVVAEEIGPVSTSCGVRFYADIGWCSLDLSTVDTLFIPGGTGVWSIRDNPEIVGWARKASTIVPRLGSICSGALILAEAGVLDGKMATTHWSRCEQMAREYPAIKMMGDRLHSYDPAGLDGDPHVFTSAGVTAGIDLALAIVEADFGRSLALSVARRLVMFLKRPGGQAQFSAYLIPETGTTARLTSLLEWLPGNIASDLSLEKLAERAGMTPRTFSRVFTRDLGMSPARYVERVRVEAARALLQDEALAIGQVAELCGFRHPETLRRAFQRHLSVSPQEYAERFARKSLIAAP
ncbi:GlxA family transcriptional regulator [Thalassospira sp.]|uniref:GlxA family transcriptional regulator n=1 Tax=Thalassospira sp. TaxID=1912094 RepID=UPI000C55F8A8|nr:GlxA family transcriptional regulator [Thalassospira sp.]MBC07944.1 AraC family transcriptional regulator [Thalassospira sp.]|tara:strand:- start:8551 stop:9582 length:1032 start_codon:yes stop_codon:yes gene_type:complete